MKIEPIFVDENTMEGLHAIHYDEYETNEFYRLIALWRQPDFVTDYCYDNQKYFESEYFSETSIDLEIDRVLNEARYLYNFLKKFTYASFEKGNEKLQNIFKPLDDRPVMPIPELEEAKFRIEDKRRFPKSILRFYGLRVDENAFIVTGGAIKLVKNMDEHDDTARELDKLFEVYKFLQIDEINNLENLTFYYGQ